MWNLTVFVAELFWNRLLDYYGTIFNVDTSKSAVKKQPIEGEGLIWRSGVALKTSIIITGSNLVFICKYQSDV